MKYRIWSKENECFTDSSNYPSNQRSIEMFFVDSTGKVKKMFCFPEDKKNDLWLEDEIDQNDYIVQHFANVLDDKNKEIYEGDVVKVSFTKDSAAYNYKYTGIVSWSNWTNQYIISAIHPATRFDTFTNRSFLVLKIIGNIFETPKLIKTSIK